MQSTWGIFILLERSERRNAFEFMAVLFGLKLEVIVDQVSLDSQILLTCPYLHKDLILIAAIEHMNLELQMLLHDPCSFLTHELTKRLKCNL
jgi:hypothetical protein